MSSYLETQQRLECCPLYAATDPMTDTIEFLGTGTLVTFRGFDLLVTAAHVIENGRKFILMVAGPEEPLLLNRSALVTPLQPGQTRQTDPFDFCVISLLPDEAARLRSKCRFIEWEREALTDVPSREWPHRFMGYPDTDNRPKIDIKTLTANCLRVDAMEDRSVIQHATAPGIKRYPTWYLGLRYDPRLLEPQSTRPKVKSLHGCSGGAIWRTDGSLILGFAGIVVQCHSPKPRPTGERIVYGFRAKSLDDLLSRWIEGGHL